jgi:hypothetical protein
MFETAVIIVVAFLVCMALLFAGIVLYLIKRRGWGIRRGGEAGTSSSLGSSAPTQTGN